MTYKEAFLEVSKELIEKIKKGNLDSNDLVLIIGLLNSLTLLVSDVSNETFIRIIFNKIAENKKHTYKEIDMILRDIIKN